MAQPERGDAVSEDPKPSVVRFSDFELDRQSGELRKRGLRVALQGRPLQILDILLRTPGQLVTRDTLRHELWSSDTFVDFEHGLNAAVRRLREALGDAADVPRFVETLPRRGYRFIAPVQGVTQAGAVDVADATPRQDSTPVAEPRSRFHGWPIVAAAVILLGGILALRHARPPAPLPAPAPVPGALTTTAGSEVMPTLSPDGSQVAFSWNG